MLGLDEYRILNCCADGRELFYVPFAELNFDGQVFPRSAGPGYSKYEDEWEWQTRVPGSEIVTKLRGLIVARLLECWLVPEDRNERLISIEDAVDDGLNVYVLYSCVTFDDHIESYGYGPHEFETTEAGVREITKDEYRMYDEALGWT